MVSATSHLISGRRKFSALMFRIYLKHQPTILNTDNRRRADLTFSVTPSQLQKVQEY